MQINSLSISQPINWFKMGWRIFMNNPLQWILMLLVLFIISIIFNLIPMVGGLIFMLISPALMAGIFLATKKSSDGEMIEVKDLFSVILDPSRRTPFFLLGVVILIFNVLIMMIVFVPIIGTAGMEYFSSDSREIVPATIGTVGIVFSLLVIPIIIAYLMAMIYAIPLMLFSDQGIKEALLLSLKASVSNILPMLLASVIYFVLAIIAVIPIGLGLLVLLPVTFGAIYVSYKDIFVIKIKQTLQKKKRDS